MVRVEAHSGSLLSSFLEIAVALTRDLDMDGVLVRIVERSMKLTRARYGAALTLTSSGTIERFLHRGMTEAEVAALPHLPRGRGLLGLVLSERAPLRIDDIRSHPAAVGFPSEHVSMSSLLGVPMMLHGDLVGALYLTKRPGDSPFSDGDEELVTAMASMAAVGIQNARLFAAERARAEHADVVREVATRVRGSLDVDEVLATTVEALGRAARVERCFIRLVDRTGDAPLGPVAYEWTDGLPALVGTSPPQFPIGSRAAAERSTQRSDDVATDPRFDGGEPSGAAEELLRHGVRAALATPLLWGDELMGIVSLHSRVPRRWTDLEIALVEQASREVATALHHARLYDEALDAAERLREVDRMRSEFVSVVSHELRSPMTVVAGIADILERRFDDLPAVTRNELLETLGREARRLTRLVSDVLDLESTDRAVSQLRVEDVDLVELAREAIADAGEGHRTKLVAEPGDAVARVDRDRIKQVLLNLLSNAGKFSGPDAPITVAVAPRDDRVDVSVTDEGPGIAPEDHELLFRRFSRVARTATRSPGSGIGLYLCKTIVDRHDGDISVASTPGNGATFTFTLPR